MLRRFSPGIAGCEVAPRCRCFLLSQLLRELVAMAGDEHPARFRFVRKDEINRIYMLFTFRQNTYITLRRTIRPQWESEFRCQSAADPRKPHQIPLPNGFAQSYPER